MQNFNANDRKFKKWGKKYIEDKAKRISSARESLAAWRSD